MDPSRTAPRTFGPNESRLSARAGVIACAVAGAVLWAGAPAGAANAQNTSAGSGVIAGRVVLQHVDAPIARRPQVADLGAPSPRDVPDRRISVVYLETAPRGAFEDVQPGRAVMNQRQETFVPHVLAITTGTVVDFPNSDDIYHNVFSLSKPARFDLGRYAAGHSKPVRFDKPGIVRVFCDIHSHMSAFILVFSHPFFAVTDTDGRFHIDHVPSGTYTVVAWNEGTTSEPRRVTVPDGGTSDVEFVLK
jgi:plastocyanin